MSKPHEDRTVGKLWNIFSIVLSVIAVCIAFLSWRHSLKLLPTQEAKIIIPENGIRISIEGTPLCPKYGDVPCYEIVDPVLKNVGEVPAKNVQLEFFGCFLNENINFDKAQRPKSIRKFKDSCGQYWNTRLVSELPQGGEATHFGMSHVPYIHENDKSFGDTYFDETFVLIFHIQYVDSLTNEARRTVNFYRYNIGQGYYLVSRETADPFFKNDIPLVSSLIIEDYAKLYPRLLKELKEDGASNELLDYIKKHPPDVYL